MLLGLVPLFAFGLETTYSSVPQAAVSILSLSSLQMLPIIIIVRLGVCSILPSIAVGYSYCDVG